MIQEGSPLMPTPMPDSELVGELPATIVLWGMIVWQSAYFILVGLAYAWVDGIYFGTILAIYALTKMVGTVYKTLTDTLQNYSGSKYVRTNPL